VVFGEPPEGAGLKDRAALEKEKAGQVQVVEGRNFSSRIV